MTLAQIVLHIRVGTRRTRAHFLSVLLNWTEVALLSSGPTRTFPRT